MLFSRGRKRSSCHKKFWGERHEVPGVVSFVSVWAGTGKAMCLAWDLVSCSHITLHICAKVVGKNNKGGRKFVVWSFEMCVLNDRNMLSTFLSWIVLYVVYGSAQ